MVRFSRASRNMRGKNVNISSSVERMADCLVFGIEENFTAYIMRTSWGFDAGGTNEEADESKEP